MDIPNKKRKWQLLKKPTAAFKKTYSIYKNDVLHFSTVDFNQEVITKIFEGTIRSASEGDTIEYGYDTKKELYGPELIVEIRNGKPMLWAYRSGRFVGYKDYDFKTEAPVEEILPELPAISLNDSRLKSSPEEAEFQKTEDRKNAIKTGSVDPEVFAELDKREPTDKVKFNSEQEFYDCQHCHHKGCGICGGTGVGPHPVAKYYGMDFGTLNDQTALIEFNCSRVINVEHDMDKLKELLSKGYPDFRKAYSDRKTVFPVQAILSGSTNETSLELDQRVQVWRESFKAAFGIDPSDITRIVSTDNIAERYINNKTGEPVNIIMDYQKEFLKSIDLDRKINLEVPTGLGKNNLK